MVTVFDYNDIAYIEWLNSNPSGLVLNLRRRLSPNYAVLHIASCRAIRNYHVSAPKGAFTERNYIKVCGQKREELDAWLTTNIERGAKVTKECSLCH